MLERFLYFELYRTYCDWLLYIVVTRYVISVHYAFDVMPFKNQKIYFLALPVFFSTIPINQLSALEVETESATEAYLLRIVAYRNLF